MERNQWMGIWAVCLPLFTLAACGQEEPGGSTPSISVELTSANLAELGATGAAKGFDLLVVTLDTVRADRLGCNGYAKAATPTIDALAAGGVNFKEAFASAPITLPSHATLFTGLSPLEHGVRNNGTFRLGPEHETLAESLKAVGYQTGAFIGAYVLDARFGLDQGFDHYDDNTNPHNLEQVSGHFNERSAALVTDATLEWWAKDAGAANAGPRFTWVHYFDAHAPYEAPGRFGPEFKSSPYDGEIAFLDSQVKRLLDSLESADRLDRTMVVITSDHGEGLGEHGEKTHSRLLYDATLRVPLIFSAPGIFTQAGSVSDRVVSLADVAPTLLDMLGVEVPMVVSGQHLFQAPAQADRSVYVETLVPLFNHGWAPLQGLHRWGDKFISAPSAEYYDMLEDRDELNNLYNSAPAGAVALRKELGRLLDGQATGAELAASEGELAGSDAARLAALGYTRGSSGGPVGKLDPKDMMPIWTAMNEANSLSGSGQHARALKKLKAILKLNPQDAYLLDSISLVYARMQKHTDAERYLQKSLKALPTAEGFVRLGQLQLARQGFGEMEASLKRASSLDPREGGVFMVRGDALASQARWAEALAAFGEALKLDPVKWGKAAQSKLEQVRARM